MSSKILYAMCDVLWSDAIRLALSRRMVIGLINSTLLIEKIKGDFRGYEMGIGDTYFFRKGNCCNWLKILRNQAVKHSYKIKYYLFPQHFI